MISSVRRETIADAGRRRRRDHLMNSIYFE
jgi:hypothetical protein